MIESVRHLYERKRVIEPNGSREDPLELGIYGLSAEQQKAIRDSGSVCTERMVSVTMVADE